VIRKRSFNVKSATNKGTLYQLKNIIHRTSVPSDPQQNVKATEDFLEVVLTEHIITAAEKEYVD
jgi:L1 cell adhesion molecule like protein